MAAYEAGVALYAGSDGGGSRAARQPRRRGAGAGRPRAAAPTTPSAPPRGAPASWLGWNAGLGRGRARRLRGLRRATRSTDLSVLAGPDLRGAARPRGGRPPLSGRAPSLVGTPTAAVRLARLPRLSPARPAPLTAVAAGPSEGRGPVFPTRCRVLTTHEVQGDTTAVAVKIRLKRLGKVRVPQYRIVVVDSRKKRDGK